MKFKINRIFFNEQKKINWKFVCLKQIDFFYTTIQFTMAAICMAIKMNYGSLELLERLWKKFNRNCHKTNILLTSTVL